MIRHIVTYQYRDEFTPNTNKRNAAIIQKKLEGLVGILPGLIFLQVITDPIAKDSQADLMINSLFTDENALAAYHKNASNLVSKVMKNRISFDYNE